MELALEMFKLSKQSCRRCGSNGHKTPCCPNTPCLLCGGNHARGIKDCPITIRALANLQARREAAADVAAPARAAKRAEDLAVKRQKTAARRIERQQKLAAKMAVYQALQPFGVEERNKSFYSKDNWCMEDYKVCDRCGKPEPKHGCWCM